MPNAAGDAPDDEIVAELMATYPTPLNQLLVELYYINRETWLSGPMTHTLEAAWVRDTGLTPWQTDRAIAVAEMMGGDHPAFVDERELDLQPAPEEIDSDTTVADLFGGELR